MFKIVSHKESGAWRSYDSWNSEAVADREAKKRSENLDYRHQWLAVVDVDEDNPHSDGEVMSVWRDGVQYKPVE